MLGFIFLVLGAQAADAPKKTFVRDQIVCKTAYATVKASLRGTAETPDDEEKEFGAPTLWIDGKKPAPVAMKTTELKFFDTTDVSSACGNKLGFNLKSGPLVLPLRVNNRPYDDKLALVWIEPKTGKAIANYESPESLFSGHGPVVEGMKDGVRYPAWNARTDEAGSFATVHGERVTVTEADFVFWKIIRLKDGKVSVEVDSAKTYEASEFKPCFKTETDFDRAFGLEKDRTGYRADNVVMVAHPGGKTCVQPTTNRQVKDGDANWYCTR